MAARTSRRLWRFSAAWFSRCAWAAAAVRARPPRPSSSNTPCISCHCRRGSNHCVQGLAIELLQPAARLPCRRDAADAEKFHELLLAFDADLADAARAGRCRHCDGALHSAKFKRTGRGCNFGPAHDQRFHFCCAVDGCRGRETPASLRFSRPPRLMSPAIVVLIAILKQAQRTRLARLSDVASVDRHTIARWRHWWRDAFARRRRSGGSRVPGSCHRSITIELPVALIERFTGDGAEPLIALLRFLGWRRRKNSMTVGPRPQRMLVASNGCGASLRRISFPRSAVVPDSRSRGA